MRVCYVDEAGCLGVLPSATSEIQPVFVIAGISVPRDQLTDLTHDFLSLKKRFYPGAHTGAYLDTVKDEIKGADLRKYIASGTHKQRRHTIGFIDKGLALLIAHNARLFGRLWVKGIGTPFAGRSIYTYSMQDICTSFQHQLAAINDVGFVIADSRNKPSNALVAHSIFTQMFRTAGNPYERIVEMPTFGHSDNHVGLQLADLVCSALLFPMAVFTYCTGHVTSLHVRPGYQSLKQRYADQIRGLQFRYEEPLTGRWRGGIIVNDAIGQRSGAEMFRVEPTP
jgi:hypothetical protein